MRKEFNERIFFGKSITFYSMISKHTNSNLLSVSEQSNINLKKYCKIIHESSCFSLLIRHFASSDAISVDLKQILAQHWTNFKILNDISRDIRKKR